MNFFFGCILLKYSQKSVKILVFPCFLKGKQEFFPRFRCENRKKQRFALRWAQVHFGTETSDERHGDLFAYLKVLF